MTREQSLVLNSFFVNLFNKVLAMEKNALAKSGYENLSVSEMHVLEAIYALTEQCKNTMTGVANQLAISVGALSTAVNTLVKKGYVNRTPCENDRRIIYITLSEIGKRAQKCHEEFHFKMIKGVSETLSEAEVVTLIETLNRLNIFFTKSSEV